MWTYMMAAARGDRASSMMARRRNESESPKYGYNLSRPMYRTTRLNGPNASSSAATYQYPGSTYGSSSSASASQMFHTSTYQLQQHQLHQQQQLAQHQQQQKRLLRAASADNNDDDYHPLAAHVNEDGTSLFSPLSTTATVTGGEETETCLFHCKNTSSSGRLRKQLIANHVGGSESNTNASVAHIHTQDSDNEDSGPTRGTLQRQLERQSKVDHQHHDDDDDDVDVHGDDEEEDYLESVIENGKRMSQVRIGRLLYAYVILLLNER